MAIIKDFDKTYLDAFEISRYATEQVKANKLLTQSFFHNRIDKELKNFNRVFSISVGKAAYAMASTLENLIPTKNLIASLVITNTPLASHCCKKKYIQSSHPYPTEKSLFASQEILKFISDNHISNNDLVIVNVSGGSSAMLSLPIEGISVDDINNVTKELINSGCDVTRINKVRKALSRIHGGGLANFISPATIISFILCDNVQVGAEAVGSGLTYPCNFHKEEVFSILASFITDKNLYKKITKTLTTRSATDYQVKNVKNITIGTPKNVLEHAKEKAEQLGYMCIVLTNELQGEAKEIAKALGSIYRFYYNQFPFKKICLISTGEVTVTVKNARGQGGRCQELAWAVAKEIKNLENCHFLSYATDGSDFISNIGGAWVSGNTFNKIIDYHLNWESILDNNNSYYGLKTLGQLIPGTNTDTNLCDLYVWCFNPTTEGVLK